MIMIMIITIKIRIRISATITITIIQPAMPSLTDVCSIVTAVLLYSTLQKLFEV